MEANRKTLNGRNMVAGLTISSLVLSILLTGLPAAAQEQQNQNSATVEQDQMDGQQGPDMGPQYSGPEDQSRRAGRMRAPMDVPATLTLQAGTVVPVRINEWLSSDKNQAGDRFTGTIEQPIIANGFVVAQRGQMVTGRVAVAQKAGRVNGVSQLGVELNELTLVDGQVLSVKTQLLQSSGGTSNGRDAAGIATTTGVGAAIGAGVNGGEGAGIGAGIGAVAGIIGVLSTRGRPTVIPPEALLTFRIESQADISTERSQTNPSANRAIVVAIRTRMPILVSGGTPPDPNQAITHRRLITIPLPGTVTDTTPEFRLVITATTAPDSAEDSAEGSEGGAETSLLRIAVVAVT
jgi:hypothetical protein